MKVIIKDEKCIGCGSCVSLTDSKIFDFNDQGTAYVKSNNIKKEETETVKQAIEYCPTGAIEQEDENK